MEQLQQWKRDIEKVSFPEIPQLIEEIDRRTWIEYRAPYTEQQFLIGAKKGSNFSLIHQANGIIPKGFPSACVTFLGCKLVETKKEHGEVMMAGGINDALGYDNPVSSLTEENWREHPEWYNYGDFASAHIPDPKGNIYYNFQSSPGGDVFFSDKKRVFVYVVDQGLQPIATVEDFIRYQLEFIVNHEGKNWYDDGYQQKLELPGITIIFLEGTFD